MWRRFFRNSWQDSKRTVRVFLSYTSREEEVNLVQPLVDRYCRGLWERARQRGLYVFYDHFSLEQKWYDDAELKEILTGTLAKAHMFVGFISPHYVASPWCCFEWRQGPMEASLSAQSVYWKRDYHDITPDDPAVVDDLDRRALTDVTFAHEDLSRVPEAAEVAVSDAADLLFRVARDNGIQP